MSLTKKPEKIIDETIEAEADEMSTPTRQKATNNEILEVVAPSILGWKITCPHCSEAFTVKYNLDGTYELHVED